MKLYKANVVCDKTKHDPRLIPQRHSVLDCVEDCRNAPKHFGVGVFAYDHYWKSCECFRNTASGECATKKKSFTTIYKVPKKVRDFHLNLGKERFL